jgi:hypothetical protein
MLSFYKARLVPFEDCSSLKREGARCLSHMSILGCTLSSPVAVPRSYAKMLSCLSFDKCTAARSKLWLSTATPPSFYPACASPQTAVCAQDCDPSCPLVCRPGPVLAVIRQELSWRLHHWPAAHHGLLLLGHLLHPQGQEVRGRGILF